RQTEIFATLHASIAAGFITYMIFSTTGPSSPYYAGLNLVGIIALCFFTFSKSFFWLTTVLIYLPYYVLTISGSNISDIFANLILNSFFMGGTIVVCAVVNHFKEVYRANNVFANYRLQDEILNRDEIIRLQTDEAVRLNSLSAQFSPQVVESIRKGKINIEGNSEKKQICSVFIDIVSSTERVTKLDKDKVNLVLSKFLDDTVKILLKYDITIDKFLGDGILGFCNAPLQRTDYVQRVVSAALEVRSKIQAERGFYQQHWMGPLEIRVGIAKGVATVGFYGSQKYFRSYTAIGPVVNLASRLCSNAQTNQILVDADVHEEIKGDFDSKHAGKKVLKGFEHTTIVTHEIISSTKLTEINPGLNDCPQCGAVLSLETNGKGQFVFICRPCCLVVDQSGPAVNVAV
ncbi:MAG: adenylate/guanylate cyclase domain-containing protein, partial [Pseudobdellovibrionaceae bacterium]